LTLRVDTLRVDTVKVDPSIVENTPSFTFSDEMEAVLL